MTQGEQIEKLTAVVQRVLTKKNGNLTPSWVYELGAKEIAEALVEEGNVVVLPCNIGDKFWWIYDIYPKKYEGEVGGFQVHKKEIFIVDVFGLVFPLNSLYFTWEDAEKALKELVNEN